MFPWHLQFSLKKISSLSCVKVIYCHICLKNWNFQNAVPVKNIEIVSNARRSNQSILKANNPEYSLEVLLLKVKIQYFDQLMLRAESLKKTLMLGKIEGKRKRGKQRIKWLNSIRDSMHMELRKLWELVEDRGACNARVHGVPKIQTWFSNWTSFFICSKHKFLRYNIFKCSLTFCGLSFHFIRYFKTQKNLILIKSNLCFFHVIHDFCDSHSVVSDSLGPHGVGSLSYKLLFNLKSWIFTYTFSSKSFSFSSYI